MNTAHRFILLAFVALLSACNSGEKSVMSGGKTETAATVNGKAISKHSVELIAKQTGAKPDDAEAQKAIIDQLALQMVVAEEAGKKGLDKQPKVQEQVQILTQSVLANAYVQDYLDSHPVTDDTLKAEYEKIKKEMAGLEYKARHILVASEAEAKDIITALKKDPAAFDKLAKEKSRDPGSRDHGGDLGWFDLTKMVPEFSDAVHALQKGSFTQEPVQSQFGFHVIFLDDTRPIEPPAFEAIKADLTQQVKQQELKKHIDEIKAKAKIEIKAAAAPKK
jgi:peptidyl-prolyl cis-trans isomerase C